jgi:hypothetical protein
VTESAAELIWLVLGVYFSSGLILALIVLMFGLKRLEPNAANMPLRVRALILPGLAALWPLVLTRLLGLRAKEDRL